MFRIFFLNRDINQNNYISVGLCSTFYGFKAFAPSIIHCVDITPNPMLLLKIVCKRAINPLTKKVT